MLLLYPTYLPRKFQSIELSKLEINMLHILTRNFAVTAGLVWTLGVTTLDNLSRPGMFLVTFMVQLLNKNTVLIGDRRSYWVLAIHTDKFVRR